MERKTREKRKEKNATWKVPSVMDKLKGEKERKEVIKKEMKES